MHSPVPFLLPQHQPLFPSFQFPFLVRHVLYGNDAAFFLATCREWVGNASYQAKQGPKSFSKLFPQHLAKEGTERKIILKIIFENCGGIL